VQSTDDFRANRDDWVFKADGSRWRIAALETDTLTTGLEATTDLRDMVGHTYQSVREDEASVAYMIGPPSTVLTPRLNVTGLNVPANFSDLEIIRGNLFTDDIAR
jgi:hypothetical protein